MVIKAILALGLFGFAAAFLVTLAKLQEEKERRWDEISRAVGLENDIKILQELCIAKENANSRLRSDRAFMQDRLSALLCPRNDHVWKDGRCAKCGRVQDAKLD